MEEMILPTDIDVFNKHKNIVPWCCHRLAKTSLIISYEEDILQVGYLALWKGIKSYDPDRAETLPAYLFMCVKNALNNWIRDNSKHDVAVTTYMNELNEVCDILDDVGECDILDDNPLDLAEEILEKYKQDLIDKHKRPDYIERRINRARVIIYEMLHNGKVGSKAIQNKYGINRTTVSLILTDIRELLKYEYPIRYRNRRQHEYEG